MLPYILAIAVALASFILFVGAFVSPKLHRQDDFLWSGIGWFYALVLWLCAGRLTGGVLLGQAAATFLLLAFGWQMLELRRAIAYPGSQTDLEGFSLTRWLGNFSKISRKPAAPAASPKTPAAAKKATEAAVTEIAAETPETAPEAAIDALTEAVLQETAPELASETAIELEEASEAVIEEAAQAEPATQEKPGFFKNLFGSRQGKPEAKPTSLTTALDAIEAESDLEEFEEDLQPEALSEPVEISENAEAVNPESFLEESETVNPVTGEPGEAAIEAVSSEVTATEVNREEF